MFKKSSAKSSGFFNNNKNTTLVQKDSIMTTANRKRSFVVATLTCVALYVFATRHDKPTSTSVQCRTLSTQSTILSATFKKCMVELGNNLPINSTGNFVAHHWEAHNGKWNEEIRFHAFKPDLGAAPLVVDVGGHTEAADSQTLKKMFPHSNAHVYEPVPEYAALLTKSLAGQGIQVHAVGLGNSARLVEYDATKLAGQATFVMESATARPESAQTMAIVDGVDELKRLMQASGRTTIDLLHMNCEGCEWELLSHMASTNMLRHVHYVQISFHNYGSLGIGDLMPQYCLIREALLRTHTPVAVVPFGWERWVAKRLVDTGRRMEGAVE